MRFKQTVASIGGKAGGMLGGVKAVSLPLGGDFNLNDVLDEVRRHYIEKAMQESGGNKSKAAKLLGLKSAPALEVQRKRLFQ